jgi:quercetin dioxygenase-like cupin family protein
MVTFLNEYAPGAQTPPHTHPGLTLVTVLEGSVTVRLGGGEKVYKVGESFTEVPGETLTALNLGQAKARLAASIVLPKGAAPSTPQAGAPAPSIAPTSLYLLRADAFFPGDAYEVVQQVLDFAPGAQTPLHSHPGQVFVTVIAGEITFTTGGATKVYKTGESFIELPEVVGQARNAGTGQATVMATYLLPKGSALSTPMTMPGTGGGGMSGRVDTVRLVVGVGIATLLMAVVLAGIRYAGRRRERTLG